MKFLIVFVCLLAATLTCAAASEICTPVTIAPAIEVPPGDLTAADLLPPGACSSLLAAAARIHLGRAPLEGIARVFEAGEIRSILRRVQSGLGEGERAVPERVVVRRTASETAVPEVRTSRLSNAARTKSRVSSASTLVRPGQTATLVWDQDGVRMVVPVTCLDRGASGESVRARVVPGGQIIHAVVVQAGLLRVVS